MKMRRYLVLTVIMASVVSGCFETGGPGAAGDEPLRVAFISHTYNANRHDDILQTFVEQINAADVDYIFALGDIVFMNKDRFWNRTLDFFSGFDAPVYYSPGNHDLYRFDIVEGLATDRHYPQRRREYRERIGYLHTLVDDERADFVLINSNDPFPMVQPFLDEALERADPDTPTLLLTHHPIWLDRHGDNWVHWYWTRLRQDEIVPYIPKFDRLVIGDVYGKLGHTTVENTPVTRIGMGNNDKPAFWVLAELEENGQFVFEQKTIDLPEGHPYRRY
jgi:3',5'-cyclic AMP phosphodiesterase CpdA